jgi:viologen exporter family transport system permease protein
LRRHLALFGEYFTQYLKVRLAYRGDFLIGVGTSLVATVFGLGFVWVLFLHIPRLADWSFDEVLFLYGFSLIPFGLYNVISVNLYEFGNEYIMEGKFDQVLVRPVASVFQVLFDRFRIESFQEVVVGLAVVGYASLHMGYRWDALDVLLLSGFAICGAAIYVSVFLMLSCVSFWFEDRIGVHPPAWNLLAFGRYPLSIYSGGIQFFLSWIVPFGFATFYPSVRLLHRAEFHSYAPLVPAVTAGFLGLAIAVWNLGVRHYSSTGS